MEINHDPQQNLGEKSLVGLLRNQVPISNIILRFCEVVLNLNISPERSQDGAGQAQRLNYVFQYIAYSVEGIGGALILYDIERAGPCAPHVCKKIRL